MKVLIVDDEILVRKGIAMGLDWKSIGFDVVKEASNGLEALEYAKINYPELVLTDIKMPKMDGIALIEKLKHYCPATKIVVLSCVEDVDLVRKSMMFGGAIDYILKLSLSTEELFNIVKRVASLIKVANKDVPVIFDESGDEDRCVNMEQYARLSKEEEKKIIRALEILDLEILEKYIGEIFLKARKNNIDKEHFQIKSDIIGLMNSEIRKYKGDISSIRIHGKHPYDYLKEAADMNDMNNRYILITELVVQYLNELRIKKNSEVINNAINYVLINYMKNITLGEVASAVGLNATYLSRKFKEETGIGFIDYLNQVRIGKAKELLEEGSMPICEVAILSGYSNDTYFSRIFKGMEGISPKQYQRERQK